MVRAVLEPGEVRDRLTRYIFVSPRRARPTGLLEVTMKKVVEADEAERKLERADPRRAPCSRYLGNDWIKEAQDKGVLSPDEADLLRDTERLWQRLSRWTISTPKRSSRITRRAIMSVPAPRGAAARRIRMRNNAVHRARNAVLFEDPG